MALVWRTAWGVRLLILFACTLFLSSALLFLVEPMFAKMVLPKLGGTPAVWITCMVFYQAVLLAGYAFAHYAARRFGKRRAAVLQIAILFLPFLVLPIRLRASWIPPTQHDPIPWLLMVLLLALGLPFFVLSTITPTLQTWYAETGHPSANDPYFLYSASNLGSMLGLLIYPVLFEPGLRLVEQSRLWAVGYGCLAVLILACATGFWRLPRTAPKEVNSVAATKSPEPLPEDNGTRSSRTNQELWWVVLAFIPSSLMLGVTTALTTEIPPIPLFWIIPLAIYLLSFILVFARRPVVSHSLMLECLPILVPLAAFPIVTKAVLSVIPMIDIDLLTLFFACMVCHGELARSRPSAAYLTQFYLCVSAGGVLGGVFNAIVAPLVFRTVAELPIALFLATLVWARTKLQRKKSPTVLPDFALPLGLGLEIAAVVFLLRATNLRPGPLMNLLIFGPPILLCLSFSKRPVRFALGFGAILLASTLYSGQYGRVLLTERSFYGIYRVSNDESGRYRRLLHGSTIHGVQSLDASRSVEPISYYYITGPIGQLFQTFSGTHQLQEVAVLGLGAGSLACYTEPSRHFTFYEIDPSVERIARDPRYFTFLRDCSPGTKVILGDARLSLQNAPEHLYNFIILDVFTSDTIPVHLMTREAIQLYLAKLAPHGLLVFNISSRYLDLEPVLGRLTQDAGLVSLIRYDANVSDAEQESGKLPSVWSILAREPADLASLAAQPLWRPLQTRPGAKPWTDDFSSILRVMRWE